MARFITIYINFIFKFKKINLKEKKETQTKRYTILKALKEHDLFFKK